MDQQLVREPNNPPMSADQELARDAQRRSRFDVRFARWIVALLILLGVGQIVLTYRVFNHTVDEPAHLAAGLEWWDLGSYQYEALHPPLARILIAAGPYFSGLRNTGGENIWAEGLNLLYRGHGSYWRNLTLARLGVIPFFVLASVLVWKWARAELGTTAGVFATLLFVTLPPILGHSAVATTDIALTATLVAAIFAFVRWLDHPTLFRSAVMGFAIAAAVLTKYSALPFLAVALPAVVVMRLFKRREEARPRQMSPKLRWQCALAVAIIAMTIFAAYRFSIGPAIAPGVESARVNRLIGQQGYLHDLVYTVVSRPVPAHEFFHGMWELYDRESSKSAAFCYVLGHSYHNHGPWFFFLVALAVKTPIPFLILAFAGGVVVSYACFRRRDGRLAALIAIPVLLLAVSSLSPLKIGLRHLLPIYPFLAVLGGAAIAHIWRLQKRRVLALLALAALLGWQLWCVGSTAPDYLAYFNEFGADHPERFLVDSDLDWGQDMFRLSGRLEELKVTQFSLAYFGNAIPAYHGLPSYTVLYANRRATGWIAVSEYVRKFYPDGYSWLDQYQPAARAGKSIRIYFIPPPVGSNP